MAKAVDNSVLDAALDKIGTSTRITACSGQPANFAGIAAVLIASSTIGGADFTNADGDASGRKVTVAQKTGGEVASTGTANHTALDDGTTLLAVTTAANQVVSSTGNTFTFNAFDIEFADPT
jgi:hypothetical protein